MSSYKRLLLSCLLVGIGGCSFAGYAQDNWAVLSDGEAMAVLKQCSRSAPDSVTGTWRIPPETIAKMESDLAKLPSQASGIEHITAFERQYTGLVLRGGRHVIYINAFPSHAGGTGRDSWREKAVVVCDGGPAFWGAVYDTQTRQFSQFAFNGPA